MIKDNWKKLIQGLIIGIIFGFLLQKGGVTQYNVIMGQLLLKDFTVLKIIATAIITGMVGIYFMKGKGLISLQPKAGSPASTIIGGLIFGAGFALVGYCPGTIAGAAGQGNLDALIGGITGIIIGSGLYAAVYSHIKPILKKGEFKNLTFPEALDLNPWKIIIPLSIILIILMMLLENFGL
ncbi:MAG: YeeE/YedE thiosulfate transporter family protein [Halanaerobiaceae bacterium]